MFSVDIIKENLKSIGKTLKADALETALVKMVVKKMPKRLKKEMRKMTGEEEVKGSSVRDKATTIVNQTKSVAKLMVDSGQRVAGGAVGGVVAVSTGLVDAGKKTFHTVGDAAGTVAEKAVGTTKAVAGIVEDKAIDGVAIVSNGMKGLWGMASKLVKKEKPLVVTEEMPENPLPDQSDDTEGKEK